MHHHHLGAIWVWSSVSVSIVVALVCVLRFSQSLSDLAFTKIAYMLCLSLSTPSWSLCFFTSYEYLAIWFLACVCVHRSVCISLVAAILHLPPLLYTS